MEEGQAKQAPRIRVAKHRMSTKVDGGRLHVSFVGGASKAWELPDRDDKSAIRDVRNAALLFAKENGATVGQQNAVRKALSTARYYLKK